MASFDSHLPTNKETKKAQCNLIQHLPAWGWIFGQSVTNRTYEESWSFLYFNLSPIKLKASEMIVLRESLFRNWQVDHHTHPHWKTVSGFYWKQWAVCFRGDGVTRFVRQSPLSGTFVCCTCDFNIKTLLYFNHTYYCLRKNYKW